MRHTRVDASLRDCRRRIAAHEWRSRRDGYAPWTVVAKSDSRIVGWGGLYTDPFEPGWGVEVGYFFHPGAWGRGYATELVAACLHVADRVLTLPEVSAFARTDNVASRAGEVRIRSGQVRSGAGAMALPARPSDGRSESGIRSMIRENRRKPPCGSGNGRRAAAIGLPHLDAEDFRRGVSGYRQGCGRQPR